MTPDLLIARVQKLLRLSTSSNANEAASAAAKAQALIDEHNLSAAMLAIDNAVPMQGPDDEPIIDFHKAGAPLDRPEGKNLDRWKSALALGVANANGCRVYLSSGSIALVGRASDAETVRYLYGYLTREVERLATEHGKGFGKSWRNNFRLGVVDAIRDKLTEQRAKFVEQARVAVVDNAQALMRVNTALARVESRGTSVDAWLKSNMKLRKTASSRTSYHPSARAAGQAAGRHIIMGGGARRIPR